MFIWQSILRKNTEIPAVQKTALAEDQTAPAPFLGGSLMSSNPNERPGE